jgi:AGCS family alanine or glycine:cation symporter
LRERFPTQPYTDEKNSGAMEALTGTLSNISDSLWTWVLIPLLLGAGLYFTIRSRFIQVRFLREMLRVLLDPATTGTGQREGISSFKAFTVSAASRVGTGNIAGVAIAISLGGAGAVFWMWVIATLGAASGFVESTLAQLYKVRDGDGFRGGPAYYMERGLGRRWMGVLFAVVIIFTFGLVFNAVQSNTITTAMSMSLGGENLTSQVRVAIGVALAVLTAIIVFGGLRRIAHVTQVLVPVMATLYIVVGLVVVALNLSEVPAAFATIFQGAFGVREAAGGGIGAAIMYGVRRGLFSNEAGLGSAPNAGATAGVSHPVKQGLIQSLGVFFDTIIVCTVTALIILLGTPDLAGTDGVAITQAALTSEFGVLATHFLTLAIFLFAYSSIIGNYYYGETNIEFLDTSRTALTSYRAVAVIVVFLGSIGAIDLIWTLADIAMGVMGFVNLIAIIPLSGIAFKLMRDYADQRAQGLDPVFHASRLPELTNIECWPEPVGVGHPLVQQDPA